MKKLPILFILVICTFGYSQSPVSNDLDYPKQVIAELTLEDFSGRGYVDDGMEKAALFIADEFEKLGLEKVGDSYFQEFEMPINIIKDAGLKLNGKELKYGVDFIVKPNSKSQKFHQKEIYYHHPEDFQKAMQSEESLIDFIKADITLQQNRHVVFPPHKFETDSINRYYKSWPEFYKPHENRERAILYFTEDKLISSLSQVQDSITEFFVTADRFTKDLSIDDYFINTEWVKNLKAKNIIGKISGERNDSILVITAHYDHLGKIGNVYFPGASDNASGTAFMLSLAKHFSENQPEFDMVFIAFAAEEAGLVGSKYFVENPVINLSKIKFLMNFDIMGDGTDGIQIVNSSVYTKEYELLNQINLKRGYVKEIKKRGEACNSDHCPFYLAGIPSIFTYTLGGPGYYHDIFDTADSISLAKFNELQKLFIEFINLL